MTGTTAPALGARRVLVRGVVQGVGFRPFVHRLALRHGLTGWVRNGSGEVELTLEGGDESLDRFLDALRTEAPPLARLERIEVERVAPAGLTGFVIQPSTDAPDRRMPVPPDVALCPACAAELADGADRRHRYPFITCTDCGPRYTVIERLPYDRERTSMRAFVPCDDCAREYASPGDRRHHSETNSCPRCGPALWFEAGAEGNTTANGEGALRAAADLLRADGIVAVRGFGGYHLACDATSEAAVAELRHRKAREAKPLAVMVGDVAEARALAEVCDEEAHLLESRERPIVLLRHRASSPLAAGVAPGLDVVGVMLPSTPVHLLLQRAVGRPLVMTSGNRSEEPIVIANRDARRHLATIADAFLMHDRDILSRCDDSVLRMAGGRPLFMRRARGYAPLPLTLPVPAPRPLLAVGPHLKNTFTLALGAEAWVSPHIGDLESLEGLEHFRHTLAVYRRLFRLDPAAVVHDLHPGYLSTRVAQEMGLPDTLAVQHHHAHIAAVMAEYGIVTPVLGVAYDGTGYGLDGAIWGAELLAGDLSGFHRLGHLRYAPLPGGDLAVRRPWRAALGYASLDAGAHAALRPSFAGVAPAELAMAEGQIAAHLNTPMASSMGRLFDAAAALLGLRLVAGYEGQAAMELEALAGRRAGAAYTMPIGRDEKSTWQLDPLPLLLHLAARRQAGDDCATLAADFHASIALATEQLVLRGAEATGIGTVVLAGGVFQNARLLAEVEERLARHALRVLVPRLLPPNDGAISYGQAAMAASALTLRT